MTWQEDLAPSAQHDEGECRSGNEITWVSLETFGHCGAAEEVHLFL